MSWKKKSVTCDHPHHSQNARYDTSGQQEGWQCRNCGYSVCSRCESPEDKPCPRCGQSPFREDKFMDKQEFIKQVEAGNRSFPEVDLHGLDLRGLDLTGFCLNGSLLDEVDLSRAILTKAYLMEARLLKANFSGADLSDANLEEANLSLGHFERGQSERGLAVRCQCQRRGLDRRQSARCQLVPGQSQRRQPRSGRHQPRVVIRHEFAPGQPAWSRPGAITTEQRQSPYRPKRR